MANDIWRSTLSSHFQTIQSHYYNITDSESWPVAGLLVLLDSNGRPVRSELHLYEDLPSHIQEAAVRQARLVLQERYHGHDLVPLRILHTAQIREAMDVRLSQPPPDDFGRGGIAWRGLRLEYLVLAGALAAVILVVWGALALLRPGSAPQIAVEPAAQSQAAGQTESDVTSVTEDLNPENETSTVAETQPVASSAVGPGELPPSRNARADIGIGVRVRILPGYSLTLRSEAGARAGEAVGFLSDEQEALVVGGPLHASGDTDTIVWWLVELESGMQAWAAANTSQTTLLAPVE